MHLMTKQPKKDPSLEAQGAQLFKVCIYGSIAAGKTSLARALVHDRFSDSLKPTAGVDFFVHEYKKGSTSVNLQLWDIATSSSITLVDPNTLALFKNTQGLFHNTSSLMVCFDLFSYLKDPQPAFRDLAGDLERVLAFVRVQNVGTIQVSIIGLRADLIPADKLESIYKELTVKIGRRIGRMLFNDPSTARDPESASLLPLLFFTSAKLRKAYIPRSESAAAENSLLGSIKNFFSQPEKDSKVEGSKALQTVSLETMMNLIAEAILGLNAAPTDTVTTKPRTRQEALQREGSAASQLWAEPKEKSDEDASPTTTPDATSATAPKPDH